ncbi:MAG: carbamoyl phosphate synthase small subunit [Ruminococcaceae bacterium]|nr:carbamoyl phosphate synthase small subunit [Oscillospiraceae bacterium]
MKKGYLVLQNGRIFEGIRFGAESDAVGELVFHTGAGGFIEILTDPAFAGQIVMQTYPLVGNYGIIHEDEEGPCRLRGYVVRECCDAPSNFRTDCDLDSYLKAQGVPGISGVDTRELTRILREEGVMNAIICDEMPADLTSLQSYAVCSAENAPAAETVQFPADDEQFKVALVDYGAKRSIIKQLNDIGCTVTVYPASASAEEILAARPDGIVLSAGPGDPNACPALTAEVKKLLGKAPLFAMGLGHQLVALAAGATVSKLKCGHRGANQAVRDLNGQRTYTTSQNHGYTVDADSIKEGALRFINVNDGTCEGIDYPAWNAFTIQFDPMLCTNTHDADLLLRRFADMMKGGDR